MVVNRHLRTEHHLLRSGAVEYSQMTVEYYSQLRWDASILIEGICLGGWADDGGRMRVAHRTLCGAYRAARRDSPFKKSIPLRKIGDINCVRGLVVNHY